MGVPHFSVASPSLIITIFTFLIFSFPSPCNSLSFEIQNNVTLLGDAYFTEDSITLTQESNHLQPPPVPSYFWPSFPTKGFGIALYKHPIRFLDRARNKTASFLCQFSFSITTSPAYPCGDGLAFLMISNATSVDNASGCGYFGLPIREKGSKESFFAIEFDTSFDPDLGDINDNHIGVDFGTVVSFASVGVEHMGINLKNGGLITAWIQYEEDTKMLQVWVSNSQVKPREPVISTKIDLLKTEVKEFMYVGFSASNRPYGSSRHVVQSCQFKSFGLVSPETGVMGDGGNGLRHHEAFSVSDGFIHSEPTQEAQKLGKMAVGLGGAAAAALLVVCAAVIMALRFGKKTNRAPTSPTEISLARIRLATEQFNQTNRLAGGASADIYKGSLGLKVVAFKRFKRQTVEEQPRTLYERERNAMSRCGFHRNIIILLGWCEEVDEHGNAELVLVYELLDNGSFAEFLDKKNSLSERKWVSPRNWLNWRRRRNIAIGLASALAYLHEGCGEHQVIHRDVKPANVLLDAEYNAVLADFGLAEVYAREQDINERLAVLSPGTTGYIDPELQRTMIPRDVNDVYSFGIVALEIATGKPPAALPDFVWGMRQDNKLMEAADSKLTGCYVRSAMKTLLLVGLLCVHPDGDQRPRMREVERMLRANRVSRQVPLAKPVRVSHPLPEHAPAEQQGDVNPDQAAPVQEHRARE